MVSKTQKFWETRLNPEEYVEVKKSVEEFNLHRAAEGREVKLGEIGDERVFAGNIKNANAFLVSSEKKSLSDDIQKKLSFSKKSIPSSSFELERNPVDQIIQSEERPRIQLDELIGASGNKLTAGYETSAVLDDKKFNEYQRNKAKKQLLKQNTDLLKLSKDFTDHLSVEELERIKSKCIQKKLFY